MRAWKTAMAALAGALVTLAAAPPIPAPFDVVERSHTDRAFNNTAYASYHALQEGDAARALKLMETAARPDPRRVESWRLLPQLGWLRLQAGDRAGADAARREAHLSERVWQGGAKCVEVGGGWTVKSTLSAMWFSDATRLAVARRMCPPYTPGLKPRIGPEESGLFHRKLDALERALAAKH